MGRYTDIKYGPLSAAEILMLAGCFLGIFALFSVWSNFGLFGSVNITGWKWAFNDFGFTDIQRFCPLLLSVIALLMIIPVVISPLGFDIGQKRTGRFLIAGSSMIFIIVVVWLLWQPSGFDMMIEYVKYGPWIALIAATLMMVGGILPNVDGSE